MRRLIQRLTLSLSKAKKLQQQRQNEINFLDWKIDLCINRCMRLGLTQSETQAEIRDVVRTHVAHRA